MKQDLKVFDGITRERALQALVSCRSREDRMKEERDDLAQRLEEAQAAITLIETRAQDVLANRDDSDRNFVEDVAAIVILCRNAIAMTR